MHVHEERVEAAPALGPRTLVAGQNRLVVVEKVAVLPPVAHEDEWCLLWPLPNPVQEKTWGSAPSLYLAAPPCLRQVADVCARFLGSTGVGTGDDSGGDGEIDRGEIGLSGGDERLGNCYATGRLIAGRGTSNATFFIPVVRSSRGDLRGCVMDRV